MQYTTEDYEQLYGRRSGDLSPEKMSIWRGLVLLSWFFALLAAAGILTGCDDGQAATVTASLEREARQRAACERNTRVAVAALNGWRIQEGDVTVSCKRVKS
jgi:hypothetical protein